MLSYIGDINNCSKEVISERIKVGCFISSKGGTLWQLGSCFGERLGLIAFLDLKIKKVSWIVFKLKTILTYVYYFKIFRKN